MPQEWRRRPYSRTESESVFRLFFNSAPAPALFLGLRRLELVGLLWLLAFKGLRSVTSSIPQDSAVKPPRGQATGRWRWPARHSRSWAKRSSIASGSFCSNCEGSWYGAFEDSPEAGSKSSTAFLFLQAEHTTHRHRAWRPG